MNSVSGASYVFRGFGMLFQPGIRRFVLWPIAINVVLFVAFTYFIFSLFGGITAYFQGLLPSWLSFLAYIATVAVSLLVLVLYGLGFNILTQIIAAPFYGMLSEKVEFLKTGQKPPEEPMVGMVTRTFARELTKLFYFLSRGLLLLLLAFIPLVNIVVGYAWGSWCMSIAYLDYSADNNKVNFNEVRRTLANKKGVCLSFGGTVLCLSIIPIVNIFVVPAAVIGGTLLWIEKIRDTPQPA